MLFSALFTKFIATIAIASQIAFAAPTATVTVTDSLQIQALTSHNNYRARHHVGPLKWNQTLVNHAASVANTCVFAHKVVSNLPMYLNIGMMSSY